MGSIERRLEALERVHKQDARSVSAEALKHLSDEDLETLAEILEDGQEGSSASWEDLYAVVGKRGRRALDAYHEAFEAARDF